MRRASRAVDEHLELGPGPLGQARLGEAQLGGEVRDEPGVAGIGLVAGEVVEFAGVGHDEALHEDVLDAGRLGGPGQRLPEVARRLHGDDERARAVRGGQLAASGDEPCPARRVAADHELAHAGPVRRSHVHHDGLLLGQVHPGDERVRRQALPAPGLLLRSTSHASRNLHGGLPSGAWCPDTSKLPGPAAPPMP